VSKWVTIIFTSLAFLGLARGFPNPARSRARFFRDGSSFVNVGKSKSFTFRKFAPRNGYIESFNGRFRDECLNQEVVRWTAGSPQYY